MLSLVQDQVRSIDCWECIASTSACPPATNALPSALATGVKLEPVQYRGEGPALADLLGGQVDFVFATPAASIEYIRAGRLRALAVTSASRAPVLPEVPAITDYVAGVEASFWTGLCAPKNTPAEVIIRLNAA